MCLPNAFTVGPKNGLVVGYSCVFEGNFVHGMLRLPVGESERHFRLYKSFSLVCTNQIHPLTG